MSRPAARGCSSGRYSHTYLAMATLGEDEQRGKEMDVGERDEQDKDGDTTSESQAMESENGDLESQSCADKEQKAPASV